MNACPFCGSEDISEPKFDSVTCRWSMSCADCGARGPDTHQKAAALRLWNERAEEEK